MKKQILKRVLAAAVALSMVIPGVPIQVQAAEAEKITIEKVSAKSHSAHGADYIMDGSTDTYWQSIPTDGEGNRYNKMYAHNRYIDITLDGMYQLSQVKIFNNVDNSYNNYYVYASADGVTYNKIISKTSDSVATAQGDSYDVNVTASHLRLNMAYNSNTIHTNLAEIELYGVRTGDRQDDTTGIRVSDWQGSEWQKEWDKFESDQEYARVKILKEMENLVGRVIGEEWKDDFIFRFRGSLQDEKDIFEVKDGEDGKIIISGNNGMAMASGFNYYLKNYVNVDFNPLFGSNTIMKAMVPVGTPVVKEAQYNLRYALNFCTYSYTMSFWNWDEYEEFLDWAAMNGINLILDIVGQEEVLRQTFLQFGFTEQEIKDYICGPAYYAWFYMQNLYSVGGPLPDAWFEQRTELGRKIHDRMQVFSITPVLQGFAGQVPHTFPDKNTGAKLAPQDNWSGHTRPALLMTYVDSGQTDYFPQVAEAFYEAQKNVFGDISDYYATDPFHEGGATGGLNTTKIFRVVQEQMMKSNPDAIWVMQQWQRNLDQTKMDEMDKEHALALYLQADMASRGNYKNEEMVFENNGTPWIYNMLHNFGGRMGLDGEIARMSKDPMETFQKKEMMVGIGITPEALENSPVIYEMFWETLWSKDPIDYKAWLAQYAKRRAGGDSESLQKAWEILLNTAYADKKAYIQGAAETVMNARPSDSFKAASTWGHSNIEYNKEELDQALLLLAENYDEFKESEAFRYDLAEVAEQVICNVAVEYHGKMVAAFRAGNLDEFTYYSNKYLALFDLAEQVLSSTDEFMLGTWIEAARKMITDADDWTKDLFEYNARALVTTWGGFNGNLKDYSNRKWAGLTTDFYKERWSIWIRNRKAELQNTEKDPKDAKAESNWFLWEYRWANRKSDDEDFGFPSEPDTTTDLGELATNIYNNYSYTAFLKGGGQSASVENAVSGIIPSLNGNTSSGELSKITDGNPGEGWVGKDTESQELTFEMPKTYKLNSFIISTIQLAKDFPYNFKLESYNPQKDTWETVIDSVDGIMGSNEEINTGITYVSNKLKLTMSTRDAVDSPLTITEFAAYGNPVEGSDTAEYVNLAQKIKATVDMDTHPQSSIDNLTDGDTSNLWKTPWPYSGDYTGNVEIDLGEQAYVDRVEVYFEKAGLPFKFKVTATTEDGTTREIFGDYKEHDETLPSASFTIPVEEEIKKVTVSFLGTTSKGAAAAATPALSEVMIFGTKPQEIKEKITFKEGKIESVQASGAGVTANATDNNKGTYDTLTLNQEVVFTLPSPHYVKQADLTFEKGEADAPNDGISIRYQLLGEDREGNRFMILDKSTTNEILPARTISIPVEAAVSRLIFIHKGNSGNGNAHGAQPRLYEFEVMGGIPHNSALNTAVMLGIENGVLSLTDGKADTSRTVEKEDSITVTLPHASDVEYVSVTKKESTGANLYYSAEYFDEKTQSWKLLCSVSGNDLETSVFGEASEPVHTKRVCFRFEEDYEISEIGVYAKDYAREIAEEINGIKEYLKTLTFGDNSGQYSNTAKAELEAALTEIEGNLTAGVGAEQVEALQKQVEDAFNAFKKKGIVYISRDKILAALFETAELIQYALSEGSELTIPDTVNTLFEEALTLYNTYQVTQKQLDDKAAELTAAISAYEGQVPAVTKEYLVVFDSDGGSKVDSQKVAPGGKAQEPQTPTRDGYTFKGWYLKEAEYDFAQEVTEHIILKAKWESDGSGEGEGGENPNPDPGGENPNPDPGGENPNPDPGGENPNPDPGGEDPNPDPDPDPGEGDEEDPGKLQSYAVINVTETLKQVALPEGYSWYDETVALAAFTGLNEKAFAALDPEGKPVVVTVKLSTIQQMEIKARTGINKPLKAGIGNQEQLTVDYEVIGSPLKDFDVGLQVTVTGKNNIVDYSVSGNDSITLVPKAKGTTTLLVELVHGSKVLAKQQQKITVADTAKKGIATMDLAVVDKDGIPLTLEADGAYLVNKDSQVYIKDNTAPYNGKDYKITFKSSDKTVAKPGKTSGKMTPIVAGQSGFALITATANDTVGSTWQLKLRVTDDSIKLGSTTVTMNKAMTEPSAEVRVYTGFTASGYEVNLDGKEMECSEDGIITIKNASKGKHSLKVKVTGTDGREYPEAEFTLTVKEVNKKPSVAIKQTKKMDSLYKAGYGEFLVTAGGEIISDVIVEGLEKEEDYEYDPSTGILTIKNLSNEKGREVIQVVYEEFAPQTKNITVAQEKHSFRLSQKSITFYKEIQDQKMYLDLWSGKQQIFGIDRVTAEVVSGDGSYKVDDAGDESVLIESLQLPSKKDKLQLTIGSEEWRREIVLTLNIEVSDLSKASLQLEKKNVTFYNYIGYGKSISHAPKIPIYLKGVVPLFDLLSMDGYELSISEGNNKHSGNGTLQLDYIGSIEVSKIGENLKAGNYKYDIALTGPGLTKPLKTTLTVKVVDVVATEKTAAKATLKATGKIDVLNRKASNVVLKTTFKNLDKNLQLYHMDEVQLAGRDGHLFEIVSVKGRDVTIRLKEDSVVLTKYGYQVALKYNLSRYDTHVEMESSPAVIKLTSKKPKVSISGTATGGNFTGENEKLNILITNSVKERIPAQKVELLNFTKDFSYDHSTGVLTHKAQGETSLGKTYTLKFAVYPQGAGDNEKPVTATYKVKIVK